MILKGSQRGGGKQLASHLMNELDNDHIELLELRGFVSEDLHGAMEEAHAISIATKCVQFLFSLSLNPPKDSKVGIEEFVDAADRAEEKLGLKGQPRAIVVHEKEGRRHAHVVWSRIDPQELKAVNLPHFKNRLTSLARDLYLEHGWALPDGFKTNGWKSPLNFTLADWQQAKRVDLDPREIKQQFQTAWQQSDGLVAFKAALEDRGYFLAAGDRRGFVAVDVQGEVFSVSRMAGVKTKDIEARLGKPDGLPSVDEVRETTRRSMTSGLRTHLKAFREIQAEQRKPLIEERKTMVSDHRAERQSMREGQDERWKRETRDRATRLRTGFKGVWDLLTGKAATIRRENDRDAWQCHVRDRAQREALFAQQMKDRQRLQAKVDQLRLLQRADRMRLLSKVAMALRLTSEFDPKGGRGKSRDFDLER